MKDLMEEIQEKVDAIDTPIGELRVGKTYAFRIERGRLTAHYPRVFIQGLYEEKNGYYVVITNEVVLRFRPVDVTRLLQLH